MKHAHSEIDHEVSDNQTFWEFDPLLDFIKDIYEPIHQLVSEHEIEIFSDDLYLLPIYTVSFFTPASSSTISSSNSSYLWLSSHISFTICFLAIVN